MIAFGNLASHLFGRIVDVQPDDVGPGRDHCVDGPVAEPEKLADDFFFDGFKDAEARAFFQEQFDLLVGDGSGRVFADTHQAQDDAGGGGQEADERRGQLREEIERPGDQRGDSFRIGQGDALWRQFAQHEREVCNADDDEGHTQSFAVGREKGPALQLAGNGPGQRRTAECAGHDADQRNADLNGRQKAARLLGQFQSPLRAHVSVLRALLEQRLARRDHGHLAHGQHAVGENEQENDDDFQRYGMHSSINAYSSATSSR